MNILVLEGKILTAIEVNKAKDEIKFITKEGPNYKMLHFQDCCESVVIEDITGDLEDLVGNPILVATESSSTGENYDTHTWTFYKLATIKGWVDIRWFGESNGYYSEEVNFVEVE